MSRLNYGDEHQNLTKWLHQIYKHLCYICFLSFMQTAMTDREHQHQRLYLEMYRKGQESARFEREEEVSEGFRLIYTNIT